VSGSAGYQWYRSIRLESTTSLNAAASIAERAREAFADPPTEELEAVTRFDG